MNALILRLKNSIDKNILQNIDNTLMGRHQFVPISVKDNFLFVAVSQATNKDEVSALLKQTINFPIKFMLVGEDDLTELLKDLGEIQGAPGAPSQQPVQSGPASTPSVVPLGTIPREPRE